MAKEKWQEDADELIDRILDNKEKIKLYKKIVQNLKKYEIDKKNK